MSEFVTTDGGAYMLKAEAKPILSVSGQLDLTREYTDLRMADGQIVRLPTALLATRPSGTVALDIDADLARPDMDVQLGVGDATVIPLIEETLIVGKRTVATGKVRLHKTVQEYEEALNEPLAVRSFDVERVILNQPVERAPDVRQDGDVTIYPLVEEQLILTKQLILKEEVRVTRRDTERRDTQVVTLRREHLEVEREPVRQD